MSETETSERPVEVDRQQRRARKRLTRSGGISFWIATAILAIVDALGIYLIANLAVDRSWSMTALFSVALIAINATYLTPRAQASKWLAPGMILMLIFIVYPVLYTTYISFTNYQTGNLLSKQQVLDQLLPLDLPADGPAETVSTRIYKNAAGSLAFLVGSDTVDPFIGGLRSGEDDNEVRSVADLTGQSINMADPPATIGDYTLLDTKDALKVSDTITGGEVVIEPGRVARLQTLTQAQIITTGKRFTYNADDDTLYDALYDTTCTTFEGNFVCDGIPADKVRQIAINAKGSRIECSDTVCDNVPLYATDQTLKGWRAVVGPKNYERVLTNAKIRQPLIRVFAWNVVFAVGSVLLNFGLGLALALTLNKEGMKGRAIYRSIYIIPYAIPGFLSIFVWRLLLNSDGKVNSMIESIGLPGPNWLQSTGGAMAAIFLVNLWLGFPYMFLINSGALTSIPEELLESARVDGAGPFRVFRSVTLPLLLVSTAPLLIGAFAFNFNNFVLIYLLTGGGPPITGYDVPVGSTDILISFTFDVAGAAGRGEDYGLATAIVVLIFLFLGTASALSFRLTKKLEEIYD